MPSRQEILQQDGFVVVRGLIDKCDIDYARDALQTHFSRKWRTEGLGKYQPDAAVEIPDLGRLISHPGVVEVFRELFGGSDPVFTGNCDAHSNMVSWWHKDLSMSQSAGFPGDYCSQTDFSICRAGVYLQDHVDNRAGLTVKPGSHCSASIDVGHSFYVPTRKGDVVFFDIRLSHAGMFADPLEYAILRIGRRLRCDEWARRTKELYWRVARKPPKQAVFFTYGAPLPTTDEFCRYELRRRAARSGSSSPALPVDATSRLLMAGARISDR